MTQKSNKSGLVIADSRLQQWIRKSFCRIRGATSVRETTRRDGPQPTDCHCHDPSGNLLDTAELQHTVANLVVEGLGDARPLIEVFRETLTDKHLAALDGISDPEKVWDLPGFDSLGRMRVAKSRKSRTYVTLADVLPVDIGAASISLSVHRICDDLPAKEPPRPSDPRPAPCVMSYGWHWWEFIFFSRTTAWTRIRCGGEPTIGSFVSVSMASGCSNPVNWALMKMRNNESDVELSRNRWGGGAFAWDVCTDHKACLAPGQCVAVSRTDVDCCPWDYV